MSEQREVQKEEGVALVSWEDWDAALDAVFEEYDEALRWLAKT